MCGLPQVAVSSSALDSLVAMKEFSKIPYKSYAYILFKISDDSQQVIVEEQREKTDLSNNTKKSPNLSYYEIVYNEIKEKLKEQSEPRYVVFHFMVDHNLKIIFVYW